MIQHAFTSAYTQRVGQQNQLAGTAWQGAKDVATLGMGIAGFSGALGDGIVAKASKYNLATKVGGIGGAIMLSTLQEKKDATQEREGQQQMLSQEDIQSQLGDNPINRPALKKLNTVFDTIMEAKQQELLNKKGNIETSMGEIDPKSELGQKILDSMKEKPQEDKKKDSLEEDEPIKKGYTRLYRGLSSEYDRNYDRKSVDNPPGYESWTDSFELAKKYGKNVYYTDIKTEDIKDSYIDEDKESETYGDRNFLYKNNKPVGLDNVSGNEFLMYVDHDLYENTKINKSKRR